MVVVSGIFLISAALLAHVISDYDDEFADKIAVYTTRANQALAAAAATSAPVLFLCFGSLCVSNGRFCGADSDGGGKAMIAIGAVLTAWTGYYVWYLLRQQKHEVFADIWRVLFPVLVGGDLFTVFGAICVDSHVAFGEQGLKQCGVGGLDGGLVMVCLGALLVTGVAICSAGESSMQPSF